MTHEEVAILWKDANGWDVRGYTNTLEDLGRFAKLVAAKALSQPKQEPPPWWPAVENILNEYGLQAIDFVAEFKKALAQPEQPQRTWQGLTDEERKNILIECESTGDWAWELNAAQAIEAKLKEKNT